MARIHIRQRSDRTYGLYTGKTCLAYGSRDTIETIGKAIKEQRQAGKVNSR